MAARRTLDTLTTIAARFGGKAVNLVVFLIVARTLPLAEVGVYGVVFSLSLILSNMLDFGIRNSLAFFIGKEPEKHAGFAAQAFVLWLGLALLAPPVMIGGLALSGLPLGDAGLNWAAGVLIVAMLYLRMMQGELLGVGEIGLFNRTELASRIVLIALTLGFVAADRLTLSSALWSLAASQAAAAVYLFARRLPVIRAGRGHMRGLGWILFSRGVVFMLSVLLMSLSKRIGILAVNRFGDADAVGIFFALQRLTEVITEVGLAISVVMFSHSVRAASGEEAARQAAHSSRIAVVVFACIAAVLGVTAPWSVPLMLGDKFAGNTSLFVLILAATLAGSVWTMVYPSLSVITSPLTVFLLFIPGLAINVALIIPLMDAFGLDGAAMAMLIGNLVLSLSFLIVFRRRFGVPIRDFVAIGAEDFGPLLTKARRWRRT